MPDSPIALPAMPGPSLRGLDKNSLYVLRRMPLTSDPRLHSARDRDRIPNIPFARAPSFERIARRRSIAPASPPPATLPERCAAGAGSLPPCRFVRLHAAGRSRPLAPRATPATPLLLSRSIKRLLKHTQTLANQN